MSEKSTVIDGFRQFFHVIQVLGKGLPGPVDSGHHCIGGDVFNRFQATREPLLLLRPTRCQCKAAIAHDHAGYTVPAGATARRIPGNLGIHVGVAVDESWGDHLAFSINNLVRIAVDATHLDNLTVLNTDVCPVSWSTRPVYDGSVLNC